MPKFRAKFYELFLETDIDATDEHEAQNKAWAEIDPRLDTTDFIVEIEEFEEEKPEQEGTWQCKECGHEHYITEAEIDLKYDYCRGCGEMTEHEWVKK